MDYEYAIAFHRFLMEKAIKRGDIKSTNKYKEYINELKIKYII